MALFSFGKKDKNPSEDAESVAKAPLTPPKIQTPPASGTIPAVRPPQPSGLIPATGVPSGSATTQPMIMPRNQSGGLKPTRPGVVQSVRSTQRIVLPSSPGGRPNTGALTSAGPTGRVNLPMGMILRCLPPEVLAADISEFEASGAAATEIGLPMNAILSQLPSGKVEMTLQDLVAHFPPGYLQPTSSLTPYLPTLINLPLMDVVMRIPPDLLALRPDQKDVDSAVINMADPFTEEILREQAEAARRAQANIIDESQVPATEEFVPQAAPSVPKTNAPLPPSVPLPDLQSTSIASAATRPPTKSVSPMPVARPLTSSPAGAHATGALPVPSAVRAQSPIPPTAPSSTSRSISPSGRLPIPNRATTPIPTRPLSAPTPLMNQTVGNLPTAALPAMTSQTTLLPLAPSSPQVSESSKPGADASSGSPLREPLPASIQSVGRQDAVTAPLPLPPDHDAEELQKLAALAMAQLDETEADPQEESSAPAQAEAPAPVEQETAVASSFTPERPTPEASQPALEPKPAFSPSPAAGRPPNVPVPALKPEKAPLDPPKQPLPSPTPTSPAANLSGVAVNLNNCTADDLTSIPGCTTELAQSIVHHRIKIGSFRKLEDLLDVPGMTKAAYHSLTGENPPAGNVSQSINELLGFSPDQNLSLKEITDRIACWPDVTGCVLSQSAGLSLVGTVPDFLDKTAIVAFAPRMFEAINKSFAEITGKETDELIIPTTGTSFHILRNKELYLIILSRLPQMPERHMKIARFVLAGLSVRRIEGR